MRPVNEPFAQLLKAEAAAAARDVLARALQEGREEAVSVLRARFAEALVDEVERLANPVSQAEQPKTEVRAPDSGDRTRPAAADGYYVYGLTWSSADIPETLSSGVDGAPIELISAGALAAVVSPLTGTEGGWGIDRRGEPDLDSLAPRALEHERVLERILERAAVLPLRFGVMCRSRADIEEMLGSHAAAVAQALERIEGHTEWGLSIDWDRGAGSAAPSAASPAEGRAYLVLRQEERAASESLEHEAREAAWAVHSAASRIAHGTVLHQSRRSRGEGRICLLGASYLVANEDIGEFRQALESTLSGEPGRIGVTAELTGPWPPFNFTDVRFEKLHHDQH